MVTMNIMIVSLTQLLQMRHPKKLNFVSLKLNILLYCTIDGNIDGNNISPQTLCYLFGVWVFLKFFLFNFLFRHWKSDVKKTSIGLKDIFLTSKKRQWCNNFNNTYRACLPNMQDVGARCPRAAGCPWKSSWLGAFHWHWYHADTFGSDRLTYFTERKGVLLNFPLWTIIKFFPW